MNAYVCCGDCNGQGEVYNGPPYFPDPSVMTKAEEAFIGPCPRCRGKGKVPLLRLWSKE